MVDKKKQKGVMVRVSQKTKQDLKNMKRRGDSFDQVIQKRIVKRRMRRK
jgi:predicted CopG family antitoxin